MAVALLAKELGMGLPGAVGIHLAEAVLVEIADEAGHLVGAEERATEGGAAESLLVDGDGQAVAEPVDRTVKFLGGECLAKHHDERRASTECGSSTHT